MRNAIWCDGPYCGLVLGNGVTLCDVIRVSEKHTACIIEVATGAVLFLRHVCAHREETNDVNAAALFDATPYSPAIFPSLKTGTEVPPKGLQISTSLQAGATDKTAIFGVTSCEAQNCHGVRRSYGTLQIKKNTLSFD
jgi:hypothetical protein